MSNDNSNNTITLEYLPTQRGNIVDKNTLYIPPEQSFYDELQQNQSVSEKFMKMFKKNPLVPMGCLATAVILCRGIWSMKTGNKAKSQQMMRYRVIAQGATVLALITGTIMAPYLNMVGKSD